MICDCTKLSGPTALQGLRFESNFLTPSTVMSTGAMHERQFWPGICWYNAGSAICLSFTHAWRRRSFKNCSFHKSALEDELVNNRSPSFNEEMTDLSVRACFKKDQKHLLHVELWSCCKLLSPSYCSNMLFTMIIPVSLSNSFNFGFQRFVIFNISQRVSFILIEFWSTCLGYRSGVSDRH